MLSTNLQRYLVLGLLSCAIAIAAHPARAQNFMVQCPPTTPLHPTQPTAAAAPALPPLAPAPMSGQTYNDNNTGYFETPYTGPVNIPVVANGVPLTYVYNGGTVKCQQISGGDGYSTMADGNQTFMFSFGPLSGLNSIKNGQPGTAFARDFDNPYCDPSQNGGATYNNGEPNPYFNGKSCPGLTGTGSVPGLMPTSPNGAVGYLPQPGLSPLATPATAVAVVSGGVVSAINVTAAGTGYGLTPVVTITGGGGFGATATANEASGTIISIAVTSGGSGYTSAPTVTIAPDTSIAATDAAAVMNTGVMNGNIPAPLIAFDEDDEFFLTLTNVGMIMRPDLFEQHTVHFHGYPNASSFYDGVPDASLAINIGASFTYYYMAPDAGTYFWHCHITPPEHLQMGMVGQLYVRPRQNRVPLGTDLYLALAAPAGTTVTYGNGVSGLSQQSDLRTSCNANGSSELYTGTAPPASGTPPASASSADILCSVPAPAADNGFKQATDKQGNPFKYVYNDGDGSTRYDIDVPVQIHGFDPNFHFEGMTFNAENFADMKDKYFLLNGRSYPDTVGLPNCQTKLGITNVGCPSGSSIANPDPGSTAMTTLDSDGLSRPSQPLVTLIVLDHAGGPSGITCKDAFGNIAAVCGQRAALRVSDLDVQEYQTVASLGVPMIVIGYNAKLLRDQAGNNLPYTTNSITLGGGESLDAIIDSTNVAPGTYFLYTPNLDHLSNDAENFGGLMAEIVVK